MGRIAGAAFLLAAWSCAWPARLAAEQQDNDHTLQAMRDEMARSKARLELKIPNSDQPVRPFYIEYRLLDLDVREIVAEFGDLLSSTHTRNRFMNVEGRVGSYKLDSSNFASDDAFRGFIGPTGSVGIDRDYDSLRQDLWIATDQAFKEAVDTYSRKKGYLSSLARPSDIDDFSKAEPVQLIEPLETPDWTNRNWEQEARETSAVMRAFSQIHESRVSYYLVYATEYLLTSEGTEIRQNRRFAAIEAGMNAVADDGVPVNHYYATYAVRPAELPNVDTVRKNLNVACTELMALRSAPPAQDYTGPVLFEARAAAPLLAEVLSPAINGARGQKVTVIENGVLKGELMSRRPGRDFEQSNGHGRAAFLNDAKPTMSNLIFTSSETLSPADLRKKFLDECRAEKSSERANYCLVVREMDNPALSLLHQDDFSELLASFGGGAGTGDRLPLIVYRIYPDSGREEIVRGARIIGLNTRALRNIAG